MRPYIFGHRGASGYEIENTITAFKEAVSMGAGIEADVQLTKDNELVCFHDPFFIIGSKYYRISKLTYKEISKIKFKDRRKIPLVKNVFDNFKDISFNLRYSFDIFNKKAGLELLRLTETGDNLMNIEITDRRLSVLSFLRNQNTELKLVHTLAEHINKVSDKTLNLGRLRKLKICTINIRCKRNMEQLFRDILDNGFSCYIWGVNTKLNMKKIIKMRYKDEFVNAIYTDYPDRLKNLMEDHFK